MDLNTSPPHLNRALPIYPPVEQLIRVTATTVPGPTPGGSLGIGTGEGTAYLYVSFVQQLRTDTLLPRDREPCLAVDVSSTGLTAGLYKGRLAGSYNGLPVYEVLPGVGGAASVGPPGPTGPTGPTGPSGPIGPIGPQGSQGPPGSAGPPGSQGPPGTQGTTGQTGPQGPIGPTGPQGAQGSAGPAGSQGPPGTQGTTGTQGPSGPSGPSGPQGAQGSAGPAGSQGPPGTQGTTGQIGSSGPTGLTGSQGPPGTQGTTGTTGGTGPTGATGPTGPISGSSILQFALPSACMQAFYASLTPPDIGTLDNLNACQLRVLCQTPFTNIKQMADSLTPEQLTNVLDRATLSQFKPLVVGMSLGQLIVVSSTDPQTYERIIDSLTVTQVSGILNNLTSQQISTLTSLNWQQMQIVAGLTVTQLRTLTSLDMAQVTNLVSKLSPSQLANALDSLSLPTLRLLGSRLYTSPFASAYLTSGVSTTSATLVNITGLSFPIGANEVWYIDATLNITSTAAAGTKLSLTGPASPTGVAIWLVGQTVNTSSLSQQILTSYGSTGASLAVGLAGGARMSGVIRNGPTAGTVQLQFLSTTGGQTSTIGAQSGLVASQL